MIKENKTPLAIEVAKIVFGWAFYCLLVLGMVRSCMGSEEPKSEDDSGIEHTELA